MPNTGTQRNQGGRSVQTGHFHNAVRSQSKFQRIWRNRLLPSSDGAIQGASGAAIRHLWHGYRDTEQPTVCVLKVNIGQWQECDMGCCRWCALWFVAAECFGDGIFGVAENGSAHGRRQLRSPVGGHGTRAVGELEHYPLASGVRFERWFIRQTNGICSPVPAIHVRQRTRFRATMASVLPLKF